MTTCPLALCSPGQVAAPPEALLPSERERLLLGLAGKLHHSRRAAAQNLGHLEEPLLRGGLEPFRQMLETAAQQTAAAAPVRCWVCPKPGRNPRPFRKLPR